MQTEIVISGFGGQGVLFAGQVLAYAAMDTGLNVTWIPSYGPEMRGGTANCTVIVSDEEIGAPLVKNPLAVIALNLPSLDKYEPLVTDGGVLVVNTALVNREVQRKDLIVIGIPANEIAERLGDKRLANMVAVGALLGGLEQVRAKTELPVPSLDAVIQALKDHLPERHQRLIPANVEALHQGMAFVPELPAV
ncbi:MAG: 2-oxoacid:acceptor oxidoreductase family protein [Anaerolineales bacterium]|nr:2-oxoacid:acceptor oxidoreductase family protein [Anaerolineales bacterium]